MPSLGTTQRRKSQSGTPKAFVLKCPEVSQSEQSRLPANDSKNTFLTVCFRVGETGLLVAKIEAKAPFHGYAKNKQQTEKKKLYDVFVKGDSYFNSGDLLRMDSEGFIYFQDRIGDTYR